VQRGDVERLKSQLARQRETEAALSAEHDKREAEGARVQAELAGVKESLAKTRGQRNTLAVLAVSLALAILAYIAIKVMRFFRVIPF
jgi:hypothetical protein